MKRIAFLGYNKPDRDVIRNGVQKVILCQADELEARGYEILYYHLFSKEEYLNLNDFLIENNVSLAVWHMTTLKVRARLHTPCPLICLWHSSPFFYKVNKLNPEQYIQGLCKKYNVGNTMSSILHNRLVSKVVISAHSLINVLLFCYVTYASSRMVLLSNGYVASFLPAKLFPKKVTAIPNMVPSLQYDYVSGPKENTALFMGRLENSNKRIDLLLDIWADAARESDWTLKICGDGTDRGMLEEKVADMGLRNVTFEGHVNPLPYYSEASIIMMTRCYEGFPMVVVEAASMGCAPIAFSSFESIFDIIDNGKNGLLIPPFDTEAYSRALRNLIENEEFRRKLAEQAQKDSARFSVHEIMNQWEALFESLLS